MPTKTDHQQLEGILKQFDPDVVARVVHDFVAAAPRGAVRHRSDFLPPGPELAKGTAGNVAMENLSYAERVILPEVNFLPAAFLEEGAVRARAVARLPKESSTNPLGDPWGTGFLVSPSLLLTNNHVIATVAEAKQILVQFNYQVDLDGVARPIDTWRLDPDAFFYTNMTLDFTLVRVKSRIRWLRADAMVSPVGFGEETEEVPATAAIAIKDPASLFRTYRAGSVWGWIQLPRSLQYAQGQFMNCVQHPAGRMKEVALQGNQLTHVFADRIHYTTDTEPGSSGSPIFNNAWDLVALHHAAGDQDSSGKWLDNEGMRVDSIVTHLRNAFGTSNPAILSELNIT